jgi:cobalt-zinc-cadmium efflux system protein
MSHSHSHSHSHTNKGKLTFAVLINVLLTIMQIMGAYSRAAYR